MGGTWRVTYALMKVMPSASVCKDSVIISGEIRLLHKADGAREVCVRDMPMMWLPSSISD